MNVTNIAPVQVNIQVCAPPGLGSLAPAASYNPYQDCNPGYAAQGYCGGVQDDIGWMNNPFGGGYGGLAPFNPYGGGFGPQDAQMSSYFQQMQTVLSMQIAVLDRMIALALIQMQMGGCGYQQPYGQQPCVQQQPYSPECDEADSDDVEPEVDETTDCDCEPEVGATQDSDCEPEETEPTGQPEGEQPETQAGETKSTNTCAPTQDPQTERNAKLERFEQSLRGLGEVSPDRILRLAVGAGLKEEFGAKLNAVLSLGKACESFDLSDKDTAQLVKLFFEVARADGDVSVLAGALQRYGKSDNSENLPESVFNTLADVAENPEGSDRLRNQLADADGWDGSGCDMGDSDSQRVLNDWAQPAVSDEQDARARMLAQLGQNLRRTNRELDAQEILEIATSSGLSKEEADRFVDFLYSATGDDREDDKLDFKDEDVRALMDVYIQAGQANGDLRGLARAIRTYGQITGHNLRDNAFDDLAAAAGNPPGAAELKDRLFQAGQSSWGPGCAVRQDDVQEVLDAAA